MKKVLLSILFATFAVASVTAADVVVEEQGVAGFKLTEPKAFDATTVVAEAAPQTTTARPKISSVNEVCGDYLMTYDSTDENDVPMFRGVTIRKVNTNTVSIESFWSPLANPITATVDFTNSKLLIQPQVIYTDETYGECDIASWAKKWYGMAIYRDKKIEVSIEQNKLTFISNWGVFINSGSQKDKYFELAENTVLTKANGRMEMVGKDGVTTTTKVVNIVQNDRDISITNFGGFGQTVTAKAYNDDTVYIPQQVAYSYYNGTEVINYYTWLVDPDKNTLTGKIINNGKMIKTEMTFGPWGVFYQTDTNNYTGYVFRSAKIYFTNGETFDCMLGVEGVEADKEVAAVKYVNLQGVESLRPTKGVNIKVTTFTDGSRKAEKVAQF